MIPFSLSSLCPRPRGGVGWIALPLILAACQSPPAPPPRDQSQASHDALVRESDQAEARMAALRQSLEKRRDQELDKDATRLANPAPDRDLPRRMQDEHAAIAQRQGDIAREMQKLSPAPGMPAMLAPEYNPLDEITVSLEMDNADVRHILTVLAKETGMNILFHPDILTSPKSISLNFQNVPAAMVFREVLRIADLYGRVEGNVMRVDPDQEVVMNLDFLETNLSSSFQVGGDVLGSGGSGDTASNSLSGKFSISGTGATVSNPYQQLQDAITKQVGEKGTFHLNPMTGTLYVKAKPSAVRAVTDLVRRYQEVLGRQILIEARIMEVTLNDQYQAGVDWTLLRGSLLATHGYGQTISNSTNTITLSDITSALTGSDVAGQVLGSDVAGLGLTISGNDGIVTLDLLKEFGDVRVLSNPSIRAKHGQPAMISVGRTNNYVRESSVTTTGAGTTSGTTETDVTVDSVFDGLMLGVVPFVTGDGRIVLSIHPIQSSVVQESLELIDVDVEGNTRVTLPKVDLKEISTLLELRNNDTVLLGGLIDTLSANGRSGVPVLSELPLIGNAFTHTSEQEAVRELILMLHVTIL